MSFVCPHQQQQMDKAVYTFEQLLHQSLGAQGTEELCKTIQRCQDRVLKVNPVSPSHCCLIVGVDMSEGPPQASRTWTVPELLIVLPHWWRRSQDTWTNPSTWDSCCPLDSLSSHMWTGSL